MGGWPRGAWRCLGCTRTHTYAHTFTHQQICTYHCTPKCTRTQHIHTHAHIHTCNIHTQSAHTDTTGIHISCTHMCAHARTCAGTVFETRLRVSVCVKCAYSVCIIRDGEHCGMVAWQSPSTRSRARRDVSARWPTRSDWLRDRTFAARASPRSQQWRNIRWGVRIETRNSNCTWSHTYKITIKSTIELLIQIAIL